MLQNSIERPLTDKKRDEVLELTHFVDHFSSAKLRVEESFGAGYVRLCVDEAQRRQAAHDIRCIEDVVIELLRNSRDAGARHIYIATAKDDHFRTLSVLDDGSGIPEDMHRHVFEPRVTSKLETSHIDKWGVHGRGMALYSIKENVCSATVMSSAPHLGCAIQVVSDATTLHEKTDQSTWPTLVKDGKEAALKLTGPHNILRTAAEFALEEHGSCEIYIGSFADIAATIRQRTCVLSADEDLLFLDSLDVLPLFERIKLAMDAAELQKICTSLGLPISLRTAQRIRSGEIKALKSIYATITHQHTHLKSSSSIDLAKEQRRLRFDPQDIDQFRRFMERDFSFLAKRYYLDLDSQPKITISHGKLTVSFDMHIQT